MILQLFNTSLRLASLALKLLLTLYMAKYLGLSDIGTFGLVAACAAISIPLLGFRLDYVVMREIVDREELKVAIFLRDEFLFYFINYIAVAAVALLVLYSWGVELDKKIYIYSLFIALLESFTTITSSNMGSLKRPILGNFLFFVRSASWVIPVIGLGLYDPAYRTSDFVFGAWICGLLLSLVFTAIALRKLPWREALMIPVNWPWIGASVKNTIPIWISGISAALAANIDRIVVETYLTREMVGVASFYGSFVVAISALLTSGIFTFKYPHLIAFFRNGQHKEFAHLTRTLIIQGSMSAAAMCLGIGVCIPLLGHYLDRPEFYIYASTLWLMLFGTWIKSTTEGLYYVQYARHQDRDIWIGNFLLLIPALAFNFLLVPRIGFIGIGYSAVLAAISLSAWRLYSLKRFKPQDTIAS